MLTDFFAHRGFIYLKRCSIIDLYTLISLSLAPFKYNIDNIDANRTSYKVFPKQWIFFPHGRGFLRTTEINGGKEIKKEEKRRGMIFLKKYVIQSILYPFKVWDI